MAPMGDSWRTADAWAVEVIDMTATPDRHDGESFRVSHHGYWVGYAQSVPELERWIDLRDLEDALSLAGPRPRSACPCRASVGARPTSIPRSCTGRSGAPVPSAARRGRARSHTETRTRPPSPVPMGARAGS